MPESYTPFVWADRVEGGTPITATQLNRIEQGVETIDDRVTALEDTAVTSTTITKMVKLTKAAYDALTPPNATTLYVIVG
jgi:hypothetical protein